MTQQVPTTNQNVQKNGQGTPPDDEFLDIVLDRPSFKPEAFTQRKEGSDKEIYTGQPVQGWLIGHADMGEIEDADAEGGKRRAYAYMVKLTAPVKCKNRTGDVVDCKPGDEIYVWENYQTAQALPPTVANHPSLCVQIKITPKFRAPIPGKKQKMWTMEFKIGKTPKERKLIDSGTSLVAQLLQSAAPLGQLPPPPDGTPF